MGFLAPGLSGLNPDFKWTKLWTTNHMTVCRSLNRYSSATSEELGISLPNSKSAKKLHWKAVFTIHNPNYFMTNQEKWVRTTPEYENSHKEKSQGHTKIPLQHFVMHTPLLLNDPCREAVHFHCIVYILWECMSISLTGTSFI